MADPSLIVGLCYLALLGALSLLGLHRAYIAALYWRLRRRAPAPAGLADTPVVTVQLPIYNERNVVERLIDAACRLDWPADRLEVQVLDDSTDETAALAQAAAARWRARGADVRVLRRETRVGYKAGALQAGLAQARGEFLAVFDADFVPPPGFLREILPHFGEPRLGMVQARWGHLNEESSLLTRLSALLLDGHFLLEHTARDRSGCFFNFNGTAGVWRRAAVESAGGWQHDTLTEDLDLSYRAQLAGWRFRFLPRLVAPGELPADMQAFKTQQRRWAKGTIQTARKLLPALLRAPQPLRVRAEAAVHLTSNLAYPLVLLLAALMPLSLAARRSLGADEVTLLALDLPFFLLSTASVGAFYALAQREAAGRCAGRLWRIPLAMALGIGISVSQSWAVAEGLFGRDVTFVRTPKSGAVGRAAGAGPRYRQRIDATAAVEIAFALYFALACAWAVDAEAFGSLPFLALFGGGFGYVGLSSLRAAR